MAQLRLSLCQCIGEFGVHIGESVTKSQTSVLQEDRGTTNLPLVKVRECSAFIRDNLCEIEYVFSRLEDRTPIHRGW